MWFEICGNSYRFLLFALYIGISILIRIRIVMTSTAVCQDFILCDWTTVENVQVCIIMINDHHRHVVSVVRWPRSPPHMYRFQLFLHTRISHCCCVKFYSGFTNQISNTKSSSTHENYARVGIIHVIMHSRMTARPATWTQKWNLRSEAHTIEQQ